MSTEIYIPGNQTAFPVQLTLAHIIEVKVVPSPSLAN
jgi:hypothetical protein